MTDRLGTGWSMHTTETGALTRSTQLTFEEQEHIVRVIQQAELLEHTEMKRVGSDTPLFMAQRIHCLQIGQKFCTPIRPSATEISY